MFKIKFKDLFKENKEYVYPRSLNEALRMNSFSIKKENDVNAETFYFSLKKGINENKEIFTLKGGIIVFSTDVNTKQESKYKIVNKVTNYINTIYNKILITRKMDKVINYFEDVYGITIGAFARGRYKSKKGSMFNETSISIEIIGISTEILDKVALELCKEFNQESVLVKNHETTEIYLIYAN